MLGVGVGVIVGATVGVGVIVGIGVIVGVGVIIGGVAVGDATGELPGVGVGVMVATGEGLGVTLAPGVGVGVEPVFPEELFPEEEGNCCEPSCEPKPPLLLPAQFVYKANNGKIASNEIYFLNRFILPPVP